MLGDLFNLGDIAAFVIGKAVGVVSYIIGFLGGLLLNLFSWIAGIMMTLNLQVFDPQNKLVHTGWAIMRDLANLGFVLVILVIAIAMMLRVGKYGSQKLLVRLIAAAILVNFSLAIAGAFLQFTNVLTAFFLNRIPSPTGLGSALAGAFNPQRLNDPQNFSAASDAISVFGASLFSLIAKNVFDIIFILIAVITVGTFAIMLFLRYLHLTFLGIVAPIIWLFWVVPDLSGKFSEWWSSFIKWAFFAPAAAFFIYLSFAALESMGGNPQTYLESLTGSGPGRVSLASGSNFFDAALVTIMSQGVQMFVLAGIMLGGLIIAQKMGIAGADIGLNLANKAKAGTLAWAGRQGKRAGARTLESKSMQGLAGTMQRIPGLRGVGMRLGGQADILRRGLVEDADKRLKKYSDAHLAKNIDTFSEPERVAVKERLAKNDTVGLIKDRAGNGDVLNNVTDKERKTFERYYGPGARQWKAFEVGAGMNVASADAIRGGNVTQLRSEMKEWIKVLKPEQISKLPTNDIFNGVDENGNAKDLSNMGLPAGDLGIAKAYRVALVNAVAQNIPSDIAKLFKSVKGAGFEQLNNTTEYVADFIEPVEPARAQKVRDVMKSIAAIRLYETGGAAASAAPAPAAPTPPPAPATPTP